MFKCFLHIGTSLLVCAMVLGTSFTKVLAADDYQDSLRSAMEVHKGDSLGMDAMMLLSRSYWSENLDSALAISQRARRKVASMDSDFFLYEAESNLGVAFLFRGAYRDALEHFYASQEAAERLGIMKKRAAANNNIAVTHQELGNYSLALDFHLRALELKSEMGDSASMQISLSNIGLLYEKLEDYGQSRHYYRRSLAMPGADSLRYATIFSNIGITYFEESQNDSALYFFNKSFSYSEPMGNMRLIGVHYQHIGAIHEREGNFDLAEREYLRALAVFEDLGKQDLVAEAYKSLGLNSLNRGQSARAVQQCSQGLDLARKTANLDKEVDCLNCLANAYKAQDNIRLAYATSEQYHALRDSLDKDAQHKEILRKDVEYAFRKRQLSDSLETARQNELVRLNYESELNRQESFGIYVGLACLFFLALALLFYINYQNKRRQSKFLEERVRERTKELEAQNEQLAEYAFINAHLLRGPLAQIMGLVGLLEEAKDQVEREQYLEMLRVSTSRLDKVIHSIRDAVEGPGKVEGVPLFADKQPGDN